MHISTSKVLPEQLCFDLHPAKSSYKTLFQGTQFGKTLNKMSGAKSVSKGLKHIECKCSVRGKHYPITYSPEQDPIQDALETKTKTAYFKLTLPKMSSKQQVAIWASETPKHFLIHVCRAVHI